MKYFTYIYLDPRKPGKYIYENFSFDYEPFYVGKGKDNRDKIHILEAKCNKGYNKHKIRKIKKILNNNQTPIIIKLKENISEEDAHKLEIFLIKLIGRSDLQKGPLVNVTDGGDGHNKIISEEQKIKISNTLKLFYVNHPEAKERAAKKATGKKQSKYQIQKRIESIKKIPNHSKKFNKNYLITSPNGITFEIFGLKDFCKTNNLYYPCMRRVSQGLRKHHKGWKVKRI